MSNPNKILIVRKIHIEALMEALHQLYHMGVEFVDLSGEVGESQDSVYLSFSKDYVHEEFKDNFDNMSEEITDIPNIEINLSDEDLNHLL